MVDGRYHHGELRGTLLDVAEALIRERGIDGWSLREASARIGVGPSAAYHHFDSRDALVRALSERVIARLGERMGRAAARARGGGQQRLVAVSRAYVRLAVEDPAAGRLAVLAVAFGPVFAVRAPSPGAALAEVVRKVEGGERVRTVEGHDPGRSPETHRAAAYGHVSTPDC